MNNKKIQNLPNTLIGKPLNIIRRLKGHSPFLLNVCLALTYRCSLDCNFCYQSRAKRDAFPDMNIEDVLMIEKNIREAFNFIPRIHLFGGEPTVNKDFMKILTLFSEKSYRISLTTNGLNIDGYIRELAAMKELAEINISLNTMHFENLLSTLQLFKKYSRGKESIINIAIPINIANQNNLVDIVNCFKTSYSKCICFQHTEFTNTYNAVLDFNAIKKQMERIKKTRYDMPIFFFPSIKMADIENYYSNMLFPFDKDKCIAPWIGPFIQPSGDVIPCDEVDAIMGNVKEESLQEIWNNKKYRNFRENIQQRGVSFPICRRCYHRQYY